MSFGRSMREMTGCRSKCFLVLCALTLLGAVIFFCYSSNSAISIHSYFFTDDWEKHRQRTRKVIYKDQLNHGNMSKSVDSVQFGFNGHMFQAVEQSDIFVISAFLEDRDFVKKKSVRILGLIPLDFKDTIWCKLHGYNQEKQSTISKSNAKIKLFPEAVAPFCRWKTALIKCPLPDQSIMPDTVSLHVTESGNITNVLKVYSIQGEPTQMLGVCSDTMYNYVDKDIGPFIEFVEINIKLGVNRIFIYGAHNVSANVMKVIQYYISQGAVSLVTWKVPMPVVYRDRFNPRDVGWSKSNMPGAKKRRHLPHCVKKHAQNLAYLDCLYSNMGKYNFLAFLDRDEVIVPHKHDSLPEMLEHLQSTLKPNVGSLTSLEHHFCTEKTDILGGSTTQKFVTNTRLEEAMGKTKKSIVKPKDVIYMHIHTPRELVPGKSWTTLSENISTVNHFRNNHWCSNQTKTVQDFSTGIYQDYLLKKIEEITKQLNIFV